MNVGREEVRLGAAFADRGLVTFPQHRVAIGEHYWGVSAYIDLAAPPLAIEVYTFGAMPWRLERQYERTEALIRAGWVVVYVWLRNKAAFTDRCVDALIECHSEVLAGPVHDTYRVIDHDGRPVALGWLSGEGLTIDDGPFPDPAHTAPKVKCCFPHRFNWKPLDLSPPRKITQPKGLARPQ